MSNSLLFLPDISGFTEFIQTTEVQHSQHVIAELLEVIIDANTEGLELAEVEGDALFFYKENEVPPQERLLLQMEAIFSAFYSHLKLLEKNRICPCNACSSAPKLQLKIVAHCGELQYLTVQNKRKPFGAEVIEAHRLMKNGVQSDNYVLISQKLAKLIELKSDFKNNLYSFEEGTNTYDGKEVPYIYSIIDKSNLKLKPFSSAKKLVFDKQPEVTISLNFPVSAETLLEFISNYHYRHHWVNGTVKFEYNENEVTRLGTEHVCVINGKHFNFISITKDVEQHQLIYGEQSSDPPPVDKINQFFIITPTGKHSCHLEIEIYVETSKLLQKIIVALAFKHLLKKNVQNSILMLKDFITEKQLDEDTLK
ncbi:DUF2652 domain-containing protein [Flammeovirga kamogawensis]|uniref:DUF2652 domain-containing protein n=1 Tax=Flammeovirga kamogawensis TaxID=373891 RepID=A0ABX8H2K1_9BACT|nr:DUF2652 domain-containing protein [Flammeovirga kamogawensis]MBB6460326.1 hypothetical protein [Flammeovirga kamogawensis]QWG10135.1 DUF2652 domain-containing protein [Flammeovirga kamogawensis]TRX65644.1 DUF2652 domain-containing protein [Flammeovirga kamogawensis]